MATYDDELEVVTDTPAYDWELFCELAYDNGKWPQNVRNFPIDATALAATNDGEELSHHALLEARIIAGMFSTPTPD